MSKAYDQVDWNFLFQLLRVMGFSQLWVDWIKQCVTTVSFSLLVNGSQSESFVPACLGEGIPLSPYLFILVVQAFSDGLEAFAVQNVCKGIQVSPREPPISHLLFADDCFIFIEHILNKLGASNGF